MSVNKNKGVRYSTFRPVTPIKRSPPPEKIIPFRSINAPHSTNNRPVTTATSSPVSPRVAAMMYILGNINTPQIMAAYNTPSGEVIIQGSEPSVKEASFSYLERFLIQSENNTTAQLLYNPQTNEWGTEAGALTFAKANYGVDYIKNYLGLQNYQFYNYNNVLFAAQNKPQFESELYNYFLPPNGNSVFGYNFHSRAGMENYLKQYVGLAPQTQWYNYNGVLYQSQQSLYNDILGQAQNNTLNGYTFNSRSGLESYVHYLVYGGLAPTFINVGGVYYQNVHNAEQAAIQAEYKKITQQGGKYVYNGYTFNSLSDAQEAAKYSVETYFANKYGVAPTVTPKFYDVNGTYFSNLANAQKAEIASLESTPGTSLTIGGQTLNFNSLLGKDTYIQGYVTGTQVPYYEINGVLYMNEQNAQNALQNYLISQITQENGGYMLGGYLFHSLAGAQQFAQYSASKAFGQNVASPQYYNINGMYYRATENNLLAYLLNSITNNNKGLYLLGNYQFNSLAGAQEEAQYIAERTYNQLAIPPEYYNINGVYYRANELNLLTYLENQISKVTNGWSLGQDIFHSLAGAQEFAQYSAESAYNVAPPQAPQYYNINGVYYRATEPNLLTYLESQITNVSTGWQLGQNVFHSLAGAQEFAQYSAEEEYNMNPPAPQYYKINGVYYRATEPNLLTYLENQITKVPSGWQLGQDVFNSLAGAKEFAQYSAENAYGLNPQVPQYYNINGVYYRATENNLFTYLVNQITKVSNGWQLGQQVFHSFIGAQEFAQYSAEEEYNMNPQIPQYYNINGVYYRANMVNALNYLLNSITQSNGLYMLGNYTFHSLAGAQEFAEYSAEKEYNLNPQAPQYYNIGGVYYANPNNALPALQQQYLNNITPYNGRYLFSLGQSNLIFNSLFGVQAYADYVAKASLGLPVTAPNYYDVQGVYYLSAGNATKAQINYLLNNITQTANGYTFPGSNYTFATKQDAITFINAMANNTSVSAYKLPNGTYTFTQPPAQTEYSVGNLLFDTLLHATAYANSHLIPQVTQVPNYISETLFKVGGQIFNSIAEAEQYASTNPMAQTVYKDITEWVPETLTETMYKVGGQIFNSIAEAEKYASANPIVHTVYRDVTELVPVVKSITQPIYKDITELIPEIETITQPIYKTITNLVPEISYVTQPVYKAVTQDVGWIINGVSYLYNNLPSWAKDILNMFGSSLSWIENYFGWQPLTTTVQEITGYVTKEVTQYVPQTVEQLVGYATKEVTQYVPQTVEQLVGYTTKEVTQYVYKTFQKAFTTYVTPTITDITKEVTQYVPKTIQKAFTTYVTPTITDITETIQNGYKYATNYIAPNVIAKDIAQVPSEIEQILGLNSVISSDIGSVIRVAENTLVPQGLAIAKNITGDINSVVGNLTREILSPLTNVNRVFGDINSIAKDLSRDILTPITTANSIIGNIAKDMLSPQGLVADFLKYSTGVFMGALNPGNIESSIVAGLKATGTDIMKGITHIPVSIVNAGNINTKPTVGTPPRVAETYEVEHNPASLAPLTQLGNAYLSFTAGELQAGAGFIQRAQSNTGWNANPLIKAGNYILGNVESAAAILENPFLAPKLEKTPQLLPGAIFSVAVESVVTAGLGGELASGLGFGSVAASSPVATGLGTAGILGAFGAGVSEIESYLTKGTGLSGAQLAVSFFSSERFAPEFAFVGAFITPVASSLSSGLSRLVQAVTWGGVQGINAIIQHEPLEQIALNVGIGAALGAFSDTLSAWIGNATKVGTYKIGNALMDYASSYSEDEGGNAGNSLTYKLGSYLANLFSSNLNKLSSVTMEEQEIVPDISGHGFTELGNPQLDANGFKIFSYITDETSYPAVKITPNVDVIKIPSWFADIIKEESNIENVNGIGLESIGRDFAIGTHITPSGLADLINGEISYVSPEDVGYITSSSDIINWAVHNPIPTQYLSEDQILQVQAYLYKVGDLANLLDKGVDISDVLTENEIKNLISLINPRSYIEAGSTLPELVEEGFPIDLTLSNPFKLEDSSIFNVMGAIIKGESSPYSAGGELGGNGELPPSEGVEIGAKTLGVAEEYNPINLDIKSIFSKEELNGLNFGGEGGYNNGEGLQGSELEQLSQYFNNLEGNPQPLVLVTENNGQQMLFSPIVAPLLSQLSNQAITQELNTPLQPTSAKLNPQNLKQNIELLPDLELLPNPIPPPLSQQSTNLMQAQLVPPIPLSNLTLGRPTQLLNSPLLQSASSLQIQQMLLPESLVRLMTDTESLTQLMTATQTVQSLLNPVILLLNNFMYLQPNSIQTQTTLNIQGMVPYTTTVAQQLTQQAQTTGEGIEPIQYQPLFGLPELPPLTNDENPKIETPSLFPALTLEFVGFSENPNTYFYRILQHEVSETYGTGWYDPTGGLVSTGWGTKAPISRQNFGFIGPAVALRNAGFRMGNPIPFLTRGFEDPLAILRNAGLWHTETPIPVKKRGFTAKKATAKVKPKKIKAVNVKKIKERSQASFVNPRGPSLDQNVLSFLGIKRRY